MDYIESELITLKRMATDADPYRQREMARRIDTLLEYVRWHLRLDRRVRRKHVDALLDRAEHEEKMRSLGIEPGGHQDYLAGLVEGDEREIAALVDVRNELTQARRYLQHEAAPSAQEFSLIAHDLGLG